MTQVVAVTDIHYAKTPGKAKTATEAAVKPEQAIIKSGTKFNIADHAPKHMKPEDFEAELRKSGAIKNVSAAKSIRDAMIAPGDELDEDEDKAETKPKRGKGRGKAKTEDDANNLV